MVMVFALVIMMVVSMFFMSMLVMVVMLMLMFVVMRMFMGVLMLLMMVMFVHVLIFFNAKCDNTCVGAFDAAFDGLLEVICDIGDSQ